MARPQKEGLDYFSLDINMFTEQDDKTYMLYAKYGLEGLAIIIKLLQRIYGDKGYYKIWGEREAFLFSKQISVDVNVINNLVSDCINEGFFNKEMFESFKILTSAGVQKRYFKACERRKSVDYDKNYLLIDPELYKKQVNVNKNGVSAGINPAVGDNNPQSKVKESKVNIVVGVEEEQRERIGKIFQFYQNNIGQITQFHSETIGQYLDEGFEPEMIIAVMQDGVGKDDRWSWIKKVLANSDKSNIKSLAQYEAKKVERENGKGDRKPKNNKPTFNNFKNREYNGKEIEEAMIEKGREAFKDTTAEDIEKIMADRKKKKEEGTEGSDDGGDK